jgi:hypothetical protein
MAAVVVAGLAKNTQAAIADAPSRRLQIGPFEASKQRSSVALEWASDNIVDVTLEFPTLEFPTVPRADLLLAPFHTKKQALNSRHQKCFTDFRREIDKCLDELTTVHQSKIASLMTLRFQSFNNVSMLGA